MLLASWDNQIYIDYFLFILKKNFFNKTMNKNEDSESQPILGNRDVLA